MKNKRPELVLILLCSLFLVLILLAYTLQGKTIALIEEPMAILQVDNTSYSLNLGVIPLQIFSLACALIFLNLAGEFFGKREAIFLSLAGGLAIGFIWLLLKGFSLIPTVENQVAFYQAYTTLFNLESRSAAALAGSVVAGFACTATLFELFRRMTCNGFVIIRIFLSQLLGLAVFAAFDAVIEQGMAAPFGQVLALGGTRYGQWFLLSFLLIPVFYILFIPFRILIGREHYAAVKARFAKGKLFLHVEKNFFEARNQVQEKRI